MGWGGMTDERETRTGETADAATATTAQKAPELLPILVKEQDHPCFSCSQCCNYVALQIDTPTTAKEYDYVVWYLIHGGVSIFVDWENDWYLKFESRCEHLTAQGLCDIYEDRPIICRDFGWRDCEKNNPDDAADKHLFETADQFLHWLETKRPKQFEKYRNWKAKRSAKGEEKELGRVKITDLLPAPPRS